MKYSKHSNYYKSIKTTSGQPVLLADGRTAGYLVDSDKTFLKLIEDKNILLRPPALCLDQGVLFKLRRQGIELIRVRHKVTGDVWELPLAVFTSKAFSINRGNAMSQSCVLLKEWSINGNDPEPPASCKVPPNPESPIIDNNQTMPIQQRLAV